MSEQLAGRVVRELVQESADSIALRFEDGSVLVIQRETGRMKVTLEETRAKSAKRSTDPTSRQRDYLEFIKKYMSRCGVSPAETDIQRHFMVSAPSVNQMVRTLEGRGFISRDRDWFGQTTPRSIRAIWDE